MSPETERVLAVLSALPKGRVASYGQVAAAAGIPNGARLVARVLHSMSRTHGLPWHRVIRSDGTIALREGEGFELQRTLLEAEGVAVDGRGRVDLSRYGAFS